MSRNKPPKTSTGHPPTFQDQLTALRLPNASRAFQRGRLASELRHCAAASSRRRAARTLSQLKQDAVRAAVGIAPELVRVGLDDDLHIGLLSVSFPGLGRIHLPIACLDPAA